MRSLLITDVGVQGPQGVSGQPGATGRFFLNDLFFGIFGSIPRQGSKDHKEFQDKLVQQVSSLAKVSVILLKDVPGPQGPQGISGQVGATG